MSDIFELDLEGTEFLNEAERLVLFRLLATNAITEQQAQEAVTIHRRNRTPILDILGAWGYISPRTYAENISVVSDIGYISDLVDSDNFSYDRDFVRQFDPAQLVRHLFCPLQRSDDMVVALMVDPNNAQATAIIQSIVPNADIVALAGTEVDVTRLVDKMFQDRQVFKAIYDLSVRRPGESASQVFTLPQLLTLAMLSLALLAGLVWQFWPTVMLLIVFINVFYTLSILYKLVLSIVGSMQERFVAVSQSDIAAIVDADLPMYSILVPVYKEPEVVPTLLKALTRLDYPREKLDVLILMEETDTETIERARAANPPAFFRFLLIPDSQPRTKPKACNYGLTFCRGDYVTIYDAEDIPEPDQLKKAVVAFRKGPPSRVCVQAALNYFNSNENYLTRMFTLEYSYWFDYMLPGLDRLRLPIPLGGTSNHFRIDRLREMGAWDPFNVTEDADLGIRASALGYTVGVINSTTYEEANKAPKNWIRQRSRWIKGYMQTWLVHNRRPLHLLRQLGLKNWLSYQFFIGGTCLTFLANPIMWLLFITWLIFRPTWISGLFSGWVLYVAAFNFLVGNMLGIYLNMLAVFRRRLFHLTVFALTNPFYWLMHSIASYMALWQLFTKPFYWEKTTHGLTNVHTQHLFEETSHAS